ncbi:MAG: alanine racemase [Bacteroidales bacterium]|nr:alanine racemase [Bacteroidales bacterium]
MKSSSIITLKETAVRNNVAFLRKKLGKTRISAVVKSNAYGHGIEQIVPLFEKEGIDHFSVFDFHEALRVDDSLRSEATIMIMGWVSNEDIGEAIGRNYEFFVFNLERLEAALREARQRNKCARVHLEVETGMNRSGLNEKNLKEAVKLIRENRDHLSIAGFCTHLAGPESISNHVRIQKQIKKYTQLTDWMISQEMNPGLRHVANSAAAFVYPKTRFDLARIGIMLYGFWSSTETFIHFLSTRSSRKDPLQRILGWESRIMSVKDVKTGEYIGYGISFLAQSDMRTALVPIGYYSGYSRSLSNRGRVLINGHRCSVIGMVNMNMIIVDITTVPEAKVYDQVVLIGQQGELEIKVSAFSDISNKLNYEVLTLLTERIERKII